MSESDVPRDRSGTDTSSAVDRPSGRRRSDRIVGAGRTTQEVVDQAMAVARADRPVLIAGAQGSGKEHLARAIHSWSGRAAGPFVVVSCAAVADQLLGRELFGCAASKYDSLPEEYSGGLTRAANGTLLIDAIDRLPAAVSSALAQAIAEGRIQREGDGAATTLRARIIATSLQSLERSPFGDVPHHAIRIAPLAERREDVLPLAAHFLRLFAEEEGIQPVGFTSDARSALLSEEWPGNVRELAERIRQSIRLAGNGAISAEALLLAADGENVPSFKEAKRAFETRYVVGLLRRCGGNISRAARLARKDRKDFYDVIRRTGVDPGPAKACKPAKRARSEPQASEGR
jgi:two-component system response regulator GlrR